METIKTKQTGRTNKGKFQIGHNGFGGGVKQTPLQYTVKKNGCYIITSHKSTSRGRITFHRKGKSKLAHRYVWELINGEIPKGKVIRHKCDNSSCINPEHLELGTQAENIKDSIESNNFKLNKLTKEEVEEILLDSNSTHKQLSRKYHVNILAIRHLRKGKTWSYIRPDIKRKMNYSLKGERNYHAKLNEQQVIQIHRRIRRGHTNIQISRNYPVTADAISKIRRGINWKHIHNRFEKGVMQ